MNKKVTTKKSSRKEKSLTLEGIVELESRSTLPKDISLSAYAMDQNGDVLASSELSSDGKYRLATGTEGKTNFNLLIAQTGDEMQLKSDALYAQYINSEDLKTVVDSAVFEKNIFVPRDIWYPWWPKQICISGHVRKVPKCPIPFVKVEIFDVDRGSCLWPWYNQFKALIRDQRVVRIEDIQAKLPQLDTTQLDQAFIDTTGVAESIDPSNDMANLLPIDTKVLNQQIEPVLRARQLIASEGIHRLVPEPVTMTSKVAPWVLFPHCFYQKKLLCTTTTNQNGYFKCCFKWYPLQFRNGRASFDFRPDIILRVTQTINGVPKVIYMDAYANTRWNSSNAHIDLFLDDPEIECGDNSSQERPADSVAFFTRIGNDEVFKIDQTNGTFDATSAGISNMAYGHALRIFAQFGDTLSRLQNIDGAQLPYFYKLSVNGSPINTALKDTRVNKSTLVSESHVLGPKTRGSETALFEIRNFEDYYWYKPDWIAHWITATTSGETVSKLIADGLKTLTLEVFDNNGVLLDNTKVNYLDGTIAPTTPPTTLPALYPCTMNVMIDNNPTALSMTVDPAPTGCGVIPLSSVPPLNVIVDVSQTNDRVNGWGLSYVKGTNPTAVGLGSGNSGFGLASVSAQPVSANSMVATVTETCAFALTLTAVPHIRNGYTAIYRRTINQAIAVDA